jgi:cell division protease FtsH
MPDAGPSSQNDGRRSRSARPGRRARAEWRQQYGLIGVARRTRKPMALWDRLKFIVILVLLWFIVVWYQMETIPILGFVDASRQELQVRSGSGRWLVLLLAIEVIRQLSYLIAEHVPWYYRLTGGAAGRGDQVTSRISDYTKFRMSRLAKWILVIAIVAIILGMAYQTTPLLGLAKAPETVAHYLPSILYVLAIVSLGILQFAGIFWFMSRGGVDVYYPGDVTTRFSDIWGQDHVLERVKENMLYLEDPESIEDHGGYVPGGVLLWGPPGTGKTLMAEAVAGETGRPYVFVDPGAFINMFFGVGILKVKSLFRRLRKLSVRYGGVIVFFDEADSLGSRGGTVGGQGGPGGQSGASGPGALGLLDACHGFSYLTEDTRSALYARALEAAPAPPKPGRFRQMIPTGLGGNMGGMGTLQALLTELSGLKKPRGFFNRVVRRTFGLKPKPPPKYRILVMMATNMPSALDPALLRPGRIDRMYRVGYPSKEGRKRTYEGYFAKVRNDITAEEIDHLATITPYATGATMKDLVNEALIVALRDGRTAITWSDVTRAKLAKSVGPSEGVEYIERERHAVALHEACHAIVSHLVQKRNVIDTATIQKGADYLGFVKPIPIEEQFTSWRSEYESDIMVSLASLVGERMFFNGDNSSGVSGDLRNATTIALAMEGLWGMGGQYGSYAATRAPQDAHPVADGNDRNVLETALGHRAESHLATLAERTGTLLSEHRPSVLAVAHALEFHKTISGQDVVAIINGEEGPVVDGRPYHQPSFAAELEAYHERAVSAHSGDRSLPLPVPVPAQPELSVLPSTPTEHRADSAQIEHRADSAQIEHRADSAQIEHRSDPAES